MPNYGEPWKIWNNEIEDRNRDTVILGFRDERDEPCKKNVLERIVQCVNARAGKEAK